MEKTNNTQASLVLSKTRDGVEKIILNFNFKSVFNIMCCFLFSSASVFSSMYPLGLSFYASVFSKNGWILNYASCIISIFVFNVPQPWIYIASLTLLTAALGVLDFDIGRYKLSTFAFVPFFILKLFFIGTKGFILYDFFALAIESAIIFSTGIIFDKGVPVLCMIGKRNYISTIESISAMTFFAFAALSLSPYPPLFGFNPANVLSILIIYIFSLGGINGNSVIMGVILGTVGSLENGGFASVTAGFAFGALLGSVFSYYGKSGVVLGFTIANTAASLILSSSDYISVSIYDSLFAALIFFAMPNRICNKISCIFKRTYPVCTSIPYTAQGHNKVTQKRLRRISRSFHELAKEYDEAAPKGELGKNYVMSKFREVTNFACAGCPSKSKCFKTSASKGYIHMSKMLDSAFQYGKVTLSTMPSEFKANCRRSSLFADKFNSMFEVIKTEKQWLAKLNESRILMSDQLCAIAQTLEEEAKKCELSFNTPLEESMWSEFDKALLAPAAIICEGDINSEFLISVGFKENKILPDTFKTVQEIITSVTGKKLNSSTPERRGEEIFCTYIPALRYSASVGYASRAKDKESISGDSLKVISTDGNNIHMILSDGMGSGKDANKESTTAVSLMEKFIRAGFDCDTAVRLINSSLLLKSSRDTFSTIDLCSVNLSDASISFIKLGAALSYIKTGEKIIAVKASSLPAGILREVEIEKRLLSINSDTIIVIMSDGVADISLKNPENDGWIEKELLKLKTSNPQIIATRLIEIAEKLQDGEVHDDMTIMVMCVKKV